MSARHKTSLSTFDAFKHIKPNENMVKVEGDTLIGLQHVLLKMLADIDDACARGGINYTLGGGSCLGAVRHHGFIPWDDDLDINMPRGDFEKLRRNFMALFGDNYLLQAPGDPGYELAFGRIRLRGTTLRTRDDFDATECGVYVDIFIIEDVPDSAPLRYFHGFGSQALGFIYSCRRLYEHQAAYLDWAEGNESLARIIRIKSRVGRVFANKTVEERCLAWSNWNAKYAGRSHEYVSIPVGRKHYFGELIKRDDYLPANAGQFEGLAVKLPRHPDVYLAGLYGSHFMEVPPVSDRESHVVFQLDLGEYK